MSPPARAQPIRFAGPAGTLEGLVDDAPVPAALFAAVICHPHPLHGGTLGNKVVHTLARGFQQAGGASLRFNFRGVGESSGAHSGGPGEIADALAAVDCARGRWPGVPLVLAGFSFGAAVAIGASAAARTDWLVSIAPAVDRVPLADLLLPACPWLIVQGADDEVVAASHVLAWAAALPVPPGVRLLAGVGHFFHGHLHELLDCLGAQWPAGLPRRPPP